MDGKTFEIKNIEFHIKQTSMNYDKCVSRAIKQFLDSNSEFKLLAKPCESIKANLDNLLEKYSEANTKLT